MNLQLAGIESVLVGFAPPPLLVHKLDHVIDSQNGDGSLSGKLEGLDFGHCGLQYSCLLVVSYCALIQVQANPTHTKIYHLHSAKAIHSVQIVSKIQGILILKFVSINSKHCQLFLL